MSVNSKIRLLSNPKVKEVFNAYPQTVKTKMLHLRGLVVNTANQIEGLDTLEETLKWGEPSYLTKYGSSLRMNWKPKNPNQYAMYFKCTSKLVPTFKSIFKNQFNYEGTRSIVFNLNEDIPETELKQCILLALTYHKRKHLPLLGA